MGLRPMPMLTVEPTACSCNAWVLWFIMGHCGPSGESAGLEEEVTALVGAVTDGDSGTFSSRGHKSASIALIMGRGSWPSIMF